jgi:hypothetical protein
MKIIIYDSKGIIPYNPNTLVEKGIGGAEVCIVNLANALRMRNHDVLVFVNCDNEGVYDGVIYKNFNKYDEPCDMFIGCESFPNNVNAKYIINWSHRPYVKDAVSFTVNKIVVPSEWSKQFLNDSRVVVIPNGIEDIYFGNKTPKIPHRIIYAGYVGKGGMAVLPRIFNKVKESFSDAEMIVCGGAKLWGNDDTKFKDIYDSLEKSGIKYIGQIGNIELSNLLQSSSILINPVGSHHKETFGLVVGQAMACGCYPISSGEGNLDNLIGSDGRCIYG